MPEGTGSQFAIGVDIGTSGCRVALCRDDGAIVAHATRPLSTLQLAGAGVEQDPEQLWTAVTDAIRQVTAEAATAGIERAAIVALGCCSQYSSTIPVDARGRPVGNMLLWMDKRGAPHNQAIWQARGDGLRRWVEIHGLLPLPEGNDCLGHALFLKHERPDQYRAARAFLEPMDYFSARLTGRVTATQCSAFMLMLTDNRAIGGLEYHPELVGWSGLDPDKLAPLVPVHEPIATLLPELARELGLAAETAVFPGLNDSQCAALACGTLRGEHAGLSIGTTSVLLGHVDRKDTDTKSSIVSMPSPIPGRYIVMAENGLGGRTLDHVLRSYFFADDALARHAPAAGVDPFAGVEAAARSVAPGSDGVVFLPWLAGSMAPQHDGRMRGGFLNLSLGSTRAHLVRAVLEGVAMNLRWLLPAVEGFVRRRFSHVVFGGGAARSRIWSQILADVLDREVHRLAQPHLLNARAAALYALARAGHADMALLDAPEIDELHAPDPGNRACYDRLFSQFVAAFEANRPNSAACSG